MVDVLLVNPPDISSKYREYLGLTAPPLGLGYIAAVLEENNYDVCITDAPALDLSWESLRKELERKQPWTIGIQTTTPTIYQAMRVARLARKVVPETHIVFGGCHATFLPGETLRQCPEVDVCVRGEGEYSMLELMQAFDGRKLLSEILGITYRSENGLHDTPPRPPIANLDVIPFPARHLLPMHAYHVFGIHYPAATMICSRGCPMQCEFCASSAMFGRKARFRSPENVIQEIEQVKRDFHIDIIAFMDDTFTLSKEWVEKLCDLMEKNNLNVTWGCQTRVDKLTPDLLSKMANSGCAAIFTGVESGVQGILDRIKKGFTIDKVTEVFRWCKKFGIRTIASFAFGFPGETRETVIKTINYAKELDPDYSMFSLATPYPGTRFYKLCEQIGIINVKDWTHYNLITPIIETIDLTLEELKQLQIRAFQEFYLRPRWIIKQLCREKSKFLGVLKQIIRIIAKDKIKGLAGTHVDSSL